MLCLDHGATLYKGQNSGPAKNQGHWTWLRPSDLPCATHWTVQQGFPKAHVHFPGGNSLGGEGLSERLSEYRRDLVKMPKGRGQEERREPDLGSAVVGLCREHQAVGRGCCALRGGLPCNKTPPGPPLATSPVPRSLQTGLILPPPAPGCFMK